ncbi:MAG: hypothetical protein KF799_14935 [Bdellovibrionales bacterium]|nr:hypothetical protein [Bdellovibrionales bacterium]
MGKYNQYVSVVLATVFAFSSIGCGNGFRTNSNSSSSLSQGQSVNVDDQIAKAQDAADEAQKAMAEAELALADIMDANGKIKINLFSASSVDSQTRTVGLLAPIVDKLNGVFDKLFSKVDVVKAQFAKARTLLSGALAQVIAGGGSQAQIDLIKAQIAKVDLLEGQFANSIHMLAGKLDLATAALDKLVLSASSLIPGIGSIAGIFIDMFLMSDVKNLIANVKARMLAV